MYEDDSKKPWVVKPTLFIAAALVLIVYFTSKQNNESVLHHQKISGGDQTVQPVDLPMEFGLVAESPEIIGGNEALYEYIEEEKLFPKKAIEKLKVVLLCLYFYHYIIV